MSEQQTQNPVFLNRRQRRQMLRDRGILKIISKMSFLGKSRSEIREQNIENGRKSHEARLDEIERKTAENLEAKLESLKTSWSEMGYNAEEVAKLEEAWSLTVIKDKSTYREDVKKSRQLMKEAQASRKNR